MKAITCAQKGQGPRGRGLEVLKFLTMHDLRDRLVDKSRRLPRGSRLFVHQSRTAFKHTAQESRNLGSLTLQYTFMNSQLALHSPARGGLGVDSYRLLLGHPRKPSVLKNCLKSP